MLALASPAVAVPSPTLDKPRLVLQITVDQLRGDLPTRYADRLGAGVQTVPGKSWFSLLRLYSPKEAWFEGEWLPGEFEVVK